MSIASVASHNSGTDTSVVACLQKVLTHTYGLYLATHNYHWNVEGEHFLPLHHLFYEQYSDLITAIDDMAERIRALDHYALPFESDNIGETFKMTSNALNKESNAKDRAERMAYNLLSLHDTVIDACQSAKAASQEEGDNETENMMVERISAHQKSVWMLRSIVK